MWNPLKRTPEFMHLAPQVIKHRSGYLVQSKDRDHEEYVSEGRSALVSVDRGRATVGDQECPAYTLYGMSLVWAPPFDAEPFSTEQKACILDRIRAALEFDGIRVTIC